MGHSIPCPERPDLQDLIRASIAAFEALPPDEKLAVRRAQRRSWVLGELMLAHPEMTREEAEKLVDANDFTV